jgi:hypothetical protein
MGARGLSMSCGIVARTVAAIVFYARADIGFRSKSVKLRRFM